MARNAVEPVVEPVRSGALSKKDGLYRVRQLVRRMIYDDQYGPNYIFMSAYDGTMLVQPFEPHKEMTRQWDLRDVHGTYIIRELVRAARSGPEGGFVSYYYYPPGSSTPQEKLAFALPVPELDCYIGTGMYMQGAYIEQKRILARARAVVAFVVSFSSPVYRHQGIVKRNPELAAEIESAGGRRILEFTETSSTTPRQHFFSSTNSGTYRGDRKAGKTSIRSRRTPLPRTTTSSSSPPRRKPGLSHECSATARDSGRMLSTRKDNRPAEVSMRYVSMEKGYLCRARD
jgi:methionine-rich copper-binding protein CopC